MGGKIVTTNVARMQTVKYIHTLSTCNKAYNFFEKSNYIKFD
jgi:hypothetical protein